MAESEFEKRLRNVNVALQDGLGDLNDEHVRETRALSEKAAKVNAEREALAAERNGMVDGLYDAAADIQDLEEHCEDRIIDMHTAARDSAELLDSLHSAAVSERDLETILAYSKEENRVLRSELLTKSTSEHDNSKSGVIILDKSGRIEYANPAFLKESGYEENPSAFIGQSYLPFIGGYEPRFEEEIKNYLRTPIAEGDGEKGGDKRTERLGIKCSDGIYRDFGVTIEAKFTKNQSRLPKPGKDELRVFKHTLVHLVPLDGWFGVKKLWYHDRFSEHLEGLKKKYAEEEAKVYAEADKIHREIDAASNRLNEKKPSGSVPSPYSGAGAEGSSDVPEIK